MPRTPRTPPSAPVPRKVPVDVAHPPPTIPPVPPAPSVTPTGTLPNVIPKTAAEHAVLPGPPGPSGIQGGVQLTGSPPRQDEPTIPMNPQENTVHPGFPQPPPPTITLFPTDGHPVGPPNPDAIRRHLYYLNDGDEIDPAWIPHILPIPPPEFCYRFVKDGRHIPAARTDPLGPRREIVAELPGKFGWSVRVPRRWTPSLFEQTFKLGPYAAIGKAQASGGVGGVISHLNDRMDAVERNLYPAEGGRDQSNTLPNLPPGIIAATPTVLQSRGPPGVITTPDGPGTSTNSETVQNVDDQNRVVKKSGLYDMTEICRMVDHLMKNYSLRPAIHALWKQECTPEQFGQLRTYESILIDGMPFGTSAETNKPTSANIPTTAHRSNFG